MADSLKELSISKDNLTKKDLPIKNFEKIRYLGKGSYARVFLVKSKINNQTYAMKIIPKSTDGKKSEVKIERDVMLKLNHKGIIKLYGTFYDKENTYFLLEYVPNGSLADLLKKMTILPLDLAQHYCAEIVDVLEYMHSKGIVHRDVKPENIMLSEDYHLKLGDFGSAKFIDTKTSAKHKVEKFVGSPEYVSPEVLLEEESGPASDLWALGCIVYQLCIGVLPFSNEKEYFLLEAIANARYKFPDGIDDDVIDLCKKLLVLDPKKRLGSGPEGSNLSYKDLKQHRFFKEVKFDEVFKIKPNIPLEIMDKPKIEKKPSEGSEDDPGDSSDEDFSSENSNKSSTNENKLVKEGIVLKKCGWIFYKQRKLKLTSKPSLSYYEPVKGYYKGDVAITKKTKAVKVTATKFHVITDKRTYYFEGLSPSDTEQWIELINSIINYYYLPSP